jgi:hypothetical protein
VYLIVNTADGVKTAMQAISTTTCTDVGISENHKWQSGVIVYPNPATTMVTLQTPGHSGEVIVRLTSPEGKLVLEKSLPANEAVNTKLNTTGLSAGIYFLNVSSGEAQKNLKLIISK